MVFKEMFGWLKSIFSKDDSAEGDSTIDSGSAGSAGKYIGDRTGVATGMILFAVAISLFDLIALGYEPSTARAIIHFIFIVAASVFLLDTTNRKLGTIAFTIIMYFSSNTFISMFQGRNFGFFYNLDFVGGLGQSLISETAIRASIPLIFFILVMLLLLKTKKLKVDGTLLFGFFLVIYVLPFLESIVLDSFGGLFGGEEVTGVLVAVLLAYPTWAILIQMGGLARPGRILKGLQYLIFIVLMVALFAKVVAVFSLGGYDLDGTGGVNPKEVWSKTWDFIKEAFTNGWSSAKQLGNSTKNNWQEDYARAQGKEFESEVEQGAIRDVGLKLLPITVSPKTVRLDGTVDFIATMEAKTFDAPIKANASCFVDPNKEDRDNIKGDISNSNFLITDYTNTQIICRYDVGADMKTTGSYTSKIQVDFNYAASAYLQRYFVKPGFLSQYAGSRRPPEDEFLSAYGFTSTKESVRTQGPIDLAINTPSVVMSLVDSAYQQQPFFLDVQLTSKRAGWTGKLAQVHNIIISVPNSFIVSMESKTIPANEKTGTSESQVDVPKCIDGGLDAEIRLLSPSECKEYSGKNGEFKDLNCDLFSHIEIVPSEDKKAEKDVQFGCYITPDGNSILGSSSFAPVTFRARVGYEYQLEEEKSFSVKASSDPNFAVTSKSLIKNTIGDIATSSEAPYKQEYSFLLSESRRNVYKEIVAAMEKFEGLGDESKAFKSFAYAYMYYYWDELSLHTTSGKYRTGNKYGPLRMDVSKYDYLIEQGLYDGSSNTTTDEKNATVATTSTYKDKQAILETKGYELGNIYFKHLIEKCTIDNSLDPACVIGKYVCHPDFVWGDYNSCGSSFDACKACHSYIVPKMYTYVKDISCHLDAVTGCWPV